MWGVKAAAPVHLYPNKPMRAGAAALYTVQYLYLEVVNVPGDEVLDVHLCLLTLRDGIEVAAEGWLFLAGGFANCGVEA